MTEDHRLIKSAKSARDGNVTEATIPADIRAKAALAVGPWADPRGELVSRIAQALLAERERATLAENERCAKIAETIKSGFWKDIADAIRRR